MGYYEEHAEEFAERTLAAVPLARDTFEELVRQTADGVPKVLDLGCGSGRDAKAFVDSGFDVDAIDASPRLCELASAHAGIDVRCDTFQEMALDEGSYDGIWACASLLHAKSHEMPGLLAKCGSALVPGGVMYASYKFGEFEGEDLNGRHFTNMTFSKAEQAFSGAGNLELQAMWLTPDARPGNPTIWLNCIAIAG